MTICVICVLSLLLSQIPNCGCEDKPQINVLAVVNGVKITKLDLSIETRTQVNLIQETVIVARSQALNQLIAKMLLEAEAKRRGLTPEKLFELEVKAKIAKPSEKEARAYYEENKTRGAPGFKDVKNQIIAQMMKEEETLREREFANALRMAAQVQISDEPVTPPTSEEDLSRVFATVNGVNITSRDIEEGLLPLIGRVQQQVYDLRKTDLDLKINDLLLEQEAKRVGTTPKALIDQNVRMKLPIITDEQARAFHNEHKKSLPGDFSDVKFQIFQYLLQKEQQKLSLAYAEQLRRASVVQIYLTAPQQPPDLRQLCCNPVD
ncbi:MAG TPA: hypothetical protein VFP64_06885 [Pyrinomonadaceae bacterium]|nr:hypothetical protein [Pyrinomonadaceae bacterium]